MIAMIEMLCAENDSIVGSTISGDEVKWALDVYGRTVCEPTRHLGDLANSLILLELAAANARHHAESEATFLLVDEFLSNADPSRRTKALDRLQLAAEHAQVAVISATFSVRDFPSDWSMTFIKADRRSSAENNAVGPISFQIEGKELRP
jgi:recombinational DNA repair ATPase RecF